MAALQGVPVAYLAKLFTKLAKAGVVVAAEGAGGGFALSKPAEEISFLDVVEAIDGREPLFACREIRDRCAVFEAEAPEWARTGRCSIDEVMLAAEARLRDELGRHSLAELAGRVADKAPAGFGIQIEAWLDNRKVN
jgi:Rrf2 family protein